MKLIVEVGLNHFGRTDLSQQYLDWFLHGPFEHITYQIQTNKFYTNHALQLPDDHYQHVIDSVHAQGKQIGLAVTELANTDHLMHMPFDFYKILSCSVQDTALRQRVLATGRPVFLSCGLVNNHEVQSIVDQHQDHFDQIHIIHTSFSYDADQQHMSRFAQLANITPQLAVGLHYHNTLPVQMATAWRPQHVFVYVRWPTDSHRTRYPDHDHAVITDDVEAMWRTVCECADIVGTGESINTEVKNFAQPIITP